MQIDNPLIIQSDRTLLLDVHAPKAPECRAALIPFAELERSPEHLHTYRLTPLSLWNAASAGFTAEQAIAILETYARYDVPQSVTVWIKETAQRFGKLRLVPAPPDDAGQEQLYLITSYVNVYRELLATPSLKKILTETHYIPAEDTLKDSSSRKCSSDQKSSAVSQENIQEETVYCFLLPLTLRGTVKQNLLQLGWPVKDEVPLREGEPLEIKLRSLTKSGIPFTQRTYQEEAAQALVGDKGPGTGFGTIVLPCGAGKTIVGMNIMEKLQTSTLIVTTNISAVHQWIQELLDKTYLTEDQIAEYSGESKQIKPVTVATYQVLTWRPDKESAYPHFQIFRERPWGLIIYDEVHMLPAPVFRVVAELQAIRRVGLTATLVREDGCQGHVFSLVGPKRYDVPWKELEQSGWIASAECIEIRLDLSTEKELEYATASPRQKHRIASENPLKAEVVRELVHLFPQDKILIIGQYLDQLKEVANMLHVPIITGSTPTAQRDLLYDDFRKGKSPILAVSKVANFAIDLPDASMAIQISGTFGSRQEEAQRLGRILRPKDRTARFFTLITRNTAEEDFGANRQKFLAEQGYSYKLIRYTAPDDLGQIMQELPPPCSVF